MMELTTCMCFVMYLSSQPL